MSYLGVLLDVVFELVGVGRGFVFLVSFLVKCYIGEVRVYEYYFVLFLL